MKQLILISILGACTNGAEVRTRPGDTLAAERSRVPAADAEVRHIGVIVTAGSADLAPRTSGVLRVVNVRSGDQVTSGMVLAEMDRGAALEESRGARAALAVAQAARRQAGIELDDSRRRRIVELEAVAGGVSPTIAGDEAEFAVRRAEAALQRASAAVGVELSRAQIAQDHLEQTILRAPFDGVVSMRLKDPGTTISSGTLILRVVSSASPRVRFAIPVAEVRTLLEGTAITVHAEAVDAPLVARVTHVSPTVDEASGMVLAEAELEGGSTTGLRPGLGVVVAR